MKRSELVLWYLEQREDDMDSEADYEREKTIIEKIIKKLVKTVSDVLLYIMHHLYVFTKRRFKRVRL